MCDLAPWPTADNPCQMWYDFIMNCDNINHFTSEQIESTKGTLLNYSGLNDEMVIDLINRAGKLVGDGIRYDMPPDKVFTRLALRIYISENHGVMPI